jgi:hypothetical protein
MPYATPGLYGQYREDPRKVSDHRTGWPGEYRAGMAREVLSGMPMRYRVNSLTIAVDLRQGMGFTLRDRRHRARRRVPVDYRGRQSALVLSHIDLRTTARIRIFRDFMLEAIAPYVPLIEGERENAWQAKR